VLYKSYVSETSIGTGANPSSRRKLTESLGPGGNQAVTDTQEILQSNQDPNPPPLMIGEGLPPVPGKLVDRIQSGHFIDLAELLPDRLGVLAAYEEEETALLKKAQNCHKHPGMGAMFWDLHSHYLKIST